VLDHTLPLPFANRYQTPRTLGTDRLAGVAGAQALFPGQSCLVVDAGTCLKFEWLENGSDYWGGSISPGLRMRFQAMHQFTSRLPLLEPAADVPLTGGSTAEAMQSGVLHGMTAEIEGIVAQYRIHHPDFRVLLTGGDAPFFEKRLFETRLKTPIFAVSELVATGLNHILNFNLQST
nr:type III pantothenate kinase [Cytophagales bacterium]